MSWLGEAYVDQGWFEVGEETTIPFTVKEIEETIAKRLKNSEWAVATDNTTITKGQRADWMAFRQALREIHLQPGFPKDIVWPNEPE